MYKKINLILTAFVIIFFAISCEKANDAHEKNDATNSVNSEKKGAVAYNVLGALGLECTSKITYRNCTSTASYGSQYRSITVYLNIDTYDYYGPEFNYKVYEKNTGNLVLNLDLCGQNVILFKAPFGLPFNTDYQVIITSQSGISNAILNDPNSEPPYPWSSYITTTLCEPSGG